MEIRQSQSGVNWLFANMNEYKMFLFLKAVNMSVYCSLQYTEGYLKIIPPLNLPAL